MQTFRGSYQATIDDKGRLKLPARLKSQLEEWFGAQVFVTSIRPTRSASIPCRLGRARAAVPRPPVDGPARAAPSRARQLRAGRRARRARSCPRSGPAARRDRHQRRGGRVRSRPLPRRGGPRSGPGRNSSKDFLHRRSCSHPGAGWSSDGADGGEPAHRARHGAPGLSAGSALRRADGVVVDATVGLGGHAAALLGACPGLRLIGLDVDPEALTVARRATGGRSADGSSWSNASYGELAAVLGERGIDQVDGVLFDLGVSSLQLDTPQRGFSFRFDAPLDMRFSGGGVTAGDAVGRCGRGGAGARASVDYGEEPRARRVARRIVQARRSAPIATTDRAPARSSGRRSAVARASIDPATRIFQALRIATNRELEGIPHGARDRRAPAASRRPPGGDRLPLARGSTRQAHAAPPLGALRVSARIRSPASAVRRRSLEVAHPSPGTSRTATRNGRTRGRGRRGCGSRRGGGHEDRARLPSRRTVAGAAARRALALVVDPLSAPGPRSSACRSAAFVGPRQP